MHATILASILVNIKSENKNGKKKQSRPENWELDEVAGCLRLLIVEGKIQQREYLKLPMNVNTFYNPICYSACKM